MCGLVGGQIDMTAAERGVRTLRHRGPDAEGIAQVDGFVLGHTRLAVQDLSDASAQPYLHGGVTLTYNGELWQPQRTAHQNGIVRGTKGDTEVVAALLDSRHPLDALRRMRGMFALAWVKDDTLYLARDEWGEVPLHYGWTGSGRFVYASEISTLLGIGVRPRTIRWVNPGSLISITATGGHQEWWRQGVVLAPVRDETSDAAGMLRGLLREGATDRMTADVPVGVLLSGGLDSAAVLALLRSSEFRPPAYIAVHDVRASDLRYARMVASHLHVDLREVAIPAPTSDDLAQVVKIIEMPHKAQVEIGWACLKLAERMRADGIKVVLSGEGSDELWASYGMDWHGIQRDGWYNYRLRQFSSQHRKNFARTNKIFARYGMEARLPFLHPPLVRYALRLSQDCVTNGGKHSKAALADAVNQFLPAGVAHRRKIAFQKGAGLDKAAEAAISDPGTFYKTTYWSEFKGVRA